MTALIVILVLVAIGTMVGAMVIDYRTGGFDDPVWEEEEG